MLNIHLLALKAGEGWLKLVFRFFSFVKLSCFINESQLDWPVKLRLDWTGENGKAINAMPKVGKDIIELLRKKMFGEEFIGMGEFYEIDDIPEIHFQNAVVEDNKPDEDDKSVRIGSIELVLTLKGFSLTIPVLIKRSVKNMREGEWMDDFPLYSKMRGIFPIMHGYMVETGEFYDAKEGEEPEPKTKWIENLEFKAFDDGAVLNGELKMMALAYWMKQANTKADHITVFRGFCKDCKYRVHEYKEDRVYEKYTPSRKCSLHGIWLDEDEASVGNNAIYTKAVGTLKGNRANEQYENEFVVDKLVDVVSDGRNSIINKSITRTRNTKKEMESSVYQSCSNYADKWDTRLDRNARLSNGISLADYMYPVTNTGSIRDVVRTQVDALQTELLAELNPASCVYESQKENVIARCADMFESSVKIEEAKARRNAVQWKFADVFFSIENLEFLLHVPIAEGKVVERLISYK